jgi:hypothetical protein
MTLHTVALKHVNSSNADIAEVLIPGDPELIRDCLAADSGNRSFFAKILVVFKAIRLKLTGDVNQSKIEAFVKRIESWVADVAELNETNSFTPGHSRPIPDGLTILQI